MTSKEFEMFLEESAKNYREYRDIQDFRSDEWMYANGCYQAVMFIIHVFSEVVE